MLTHGYVKNSKILTRTVFNTNKMFFIVFFCYFARKKFLLFSLNILKLILNILNLLLN